MEVRQLEGLAVLLALLLCVAEEAAAGRGGAPAPAAARVRVDVHLALACVRHVSRGRTQACGVRRTVLRASAAAGLADGADEVVRHGAGTAAVVPLRSRFWLARARAAYARHAAGLAGL